MGFARVAPISLRPTPTRRQRAPILMVSTPPSRRTFLVNVATIGAGTFLCAKRATALLTTASAAALLRDARASLASLQEAAELHEYESLRVALRTGSLAQIRAAGTVVAGKDKNRRASYRRLVSAVEELDVHALRAERGGDKTVVGADVIQAMKTMDAFLLQIE